MKLLRAGVLVGVALLAYAAHAQELALQGRTVESIRVVDSSTGRELAKPLPKLPLEPGKPFDIAEERESLRELYRMGDFADIRAQAEEGPGGLRIAFLVQRNFYNGIVRVEGLRPPPNESLALAALRLPLGEPFRKSALDESLARLRNTLRDDGFYQAKLEPQLHPHEDTRQMDLTVRVTPGPRARMGKIVFQNQTTIPTEELLDKSKLESGDAITFNRLERSTDRLRKYLVGKEHLSARAVLRRGDYDAQTNSVPLTLEVTAGPRVRAVVTGAKFSGSKLKKLLPMYAEGAVDEDLLEEGRRNLRDS
ncbi:MAG: POTRA domain-containing protein, partial [Steroidobacteraceae bacterium]